MPHVDRNGSPAFALPAECGMIITSLFKAWKRIMGPGLRRSTGRQTSTADDWSLQDPSTLKESVGTKLSREEE
jgi:hypothetical protein